MAAWDSGEATVAPRWTGETSVGCVAAINGLIAPALIGQDATQITSLTQKMDRVIKHNPFVKSAIEMALWDWRARRPTCRSINCWGGRVRESVPIKMVISVLIFRRLSLWPNGSSTWACVA